jgi:hypothetical protein
MRGSAAKGGDVAHGPHASSAGPSWPKGPAQGPHVPGLCLGRYHTGRQPGAALQNTVICPAGPPPARSRAAWAGGQSHSTHDTVIRPGPHSCRCGSIRVAPPVRPPDPMARLDQRRGPSDAGGSARQHRSGTYSPRPAYLNLRTWTAWPQGTSAPPFGRRGVGGGLIIIRAGADLHGRRAATG